MTRHMEPGILRFQTCLSEQVEQQIVLNRHMVCTNSIINGLVSQLFHQMKRKRKAVQCTLIPPQCILVTLRVSQLDNFPSTGGSRLCKTHFKSLTSELLLMSDIMNVRYLLYLTINIDLH